MRRQSHPARDVPVHAATGHAKAVAGARPLGAPTHEPSHAPAVGDALPLAAGDERHITLGAHAELGHRAARFWARQREGARRHAAARDGSAGFALSRAGEAAWASTPATPVYLVPDTPVEAYDHAPRAAHALKRAIDLLGAVVGLLLTAPLLAVLAVLVRLGSPGPVFFAQARVGRGGRVFRCYKLRTMRHDAESLLRTDADLRATYERHGFKIPCDADHRVTPIGRLLRLTSCDELPQLWNVLKGEMSLVGPRPLVVRELSHYPGTDRDVLLSVRPGLTGAWAVGGRSRVGYPQRARMELDYVRGWSMGRDVLILLKTIGAVLARRGAA